MASYLFQFEIELKSVPVRLISKKILNLSLLGILTVLI